MFASLQSKNNLVIIPFLELLIVEQLQELKTFLLKIKHKIIRPIKKLMYVILLQQLYLSKLL